MQGESNVEWAPVGVTKKEGTGAGFSFLMQRSAGDLEGRVT